MCAGTDATLEAPSSASTTPSSGAGVSRTWASEQRVKDRGQLGGCHPRSSEIAAWPRRAGSEPELRELQRLGDEHDLANVEGYVNKVRGRARDFPGAAILSKVNNAINQ